MVRSSDSVDAAAGTEPRGLLLAEGRTKSTNTSKSKSKSRSGAVERLSIRSRWDAPPCPSFLRGEAFRDTRGGKSSFVRSQLFNSPGLKSHGDRSRAYPGETR